MIRRIFDYLVLFKNRRCEQRAIARYCDELDPAEGDVIRPYSEYEEEVEDYNEDEDDEPLTWAELKNVRKELRRFQLWHALRKKVPKGFEEAD